MTSLFALMRKEFRQTFRDPRLVFMLFGVPLIQLVVFGYAVNLDVEHLQTVLCDLDDTPASRLFAASFFADRTFVKWKQVSDADRASRLLENGMAKVALVFPAGFGSDLAAGRCTAGQVLVDGTDPNRANLAVNAARQFFSSMALTLSSALLERLSFSLNQAVTVPAVLLEPRIYFNPQLKSSIFMVPGVAATLLLILTTILTAVGIARERELGTLEQIMVTPLTKSRLIIGKTVPYAIIGYVDVLIVLVAGAYLFHVPLQGHFWLLFLATGLFLLSTLGAGLFVSTISATQQQAFLGAFFFIFPAILLGGFLTPIENMPDWVGWFSCFNPVRYFVEILRGSLLKNAGWSDLWPQIVSLAAFGSSILTLSAFRFSKRLK